MVATTATSDALDGRVSPTAEPLLIDQFMPTYDLAIVYSRVFRAPPEQCFKTVVDFDLFQIPVFRMLIGVRGLPPRLADVVRRRGGQAGAPATPTFRLRDRVDPYGERASIVTMETRVICTDQDSRRRFRRYWLVVGPCSHLLRRTALRVWGRRLEGPR